LSWTEHRTSNPRVAGSNPARRTRKSDTSVTAQNAAVTIGHAATGSAMGRSGSVTVIQRFGSGLNLNVHFHTLLFDVVFFAGGANDELDFRPLPPPTDEEVGVVLARIAARVQRLLRRRELDPDDADVFQADPVVEDSPALAGVSSASIQGRIA